MEIANYSGLLVLLGLVVIVVAVIMSLATFFGPSNPTRQKLMPYEAGSDPINRPREHRFSVKFYMIAISFILFDLETIFVVPWAISWRDSEALGHGIFSFGVMFIFVLILTLGLVYEWKQGGLEWD